MSLKRAKSILKSARNFAIACFFCWLIFSPVPGENNNKPQQPIETIYIRGGGKQYKVDHSVDNLDEKKFLREMLAKHFLD